MERTNHVQRRWNNPQRGAPKDHLPAAMGGFLLQQTNVNLIVGPRALRQQHVARRRPDPPALAAAGNGAARKMPPPYSSGPSRHCSVVSEESLDVDSDNNNNNKRQALDDVRFGNSRFGNAFANKRPRKRPIFHDSSESSSEDEVEYIVTSLNHGMGNTAGDPAVGMVRSFIQGQGMPGSPGPQRKSPPGKNGEVIDLCDDNGSSDDSDQEELEQERSNLVNWEDHKPSAVFGVGRGRAFKSEVLSSGQTIEFGINHSKTAELRRLEQSRGPAFAASPASPPFPNAARPGAASAAIRSPFASASPIRNGRVKNDSFQGNGRGTGNHRSAAGGPAVASPLVQGQLSPEFFGRRRSSPGSQRASPPGRNEGRGDDVIDLCDDSDGDISDDYDDSDNQGHGVARAAANQDLAVSAAAEASAELLIAVGRMLSKVITNASRDPRDPFSLDEFQRLWCCAELVHGMSTKDLEGNKLVRMANKKIVGIEQKHAQYGRLLPLALDKMFNFLNMNKDDVFLDIGHGVGNAVLQAAYTIGCAAKGIELIPDRNFCAISFNTSISDGADTLRGNRILTFTEGKVMFCEGALEDPKHRDFVTKGVTVALCNNFGDVFGIRCDNGSKTTYSLDDHLAGNFALMQEGARLVTLNPLIGRLECQPRGLANKTRARRGSCGHYQCKGLSCRLSSYYEVEELVLGKQNETVSWSEGGGCGRAVKAYVYTRVDQGTPDGRAVFLCANFEGCDKARNNIPIPAVQFTDEDKPIIGSCSCRVAKPHLRTRRTAPNYKAQF